MVCRAGDVAAVCVARMVLNNGSRALDKACHYWNQGGYHHPLYNRPETRE